MTSARMNGFVTGAGACPSPAWRALRVEKSVLSCGSVCRSCVTVTARPASTHTELVSQ